MRCVCDNEFSAFDNHILCPDCRKALGSTYTAYYQSWYDMLYHTEEGAFSRYRQQYLGRRAGAVAALAAAGRISTERQKALLRDTEPQTKRSAGTAA